MSEKIVNDLVNYVFENSISFDGERHDIPLDKSLIEVGIFDSYEIIELVAFIESNWSIVITKEDLTFEKMGSVMKMTKLISGKIAK